MYKAKKSGSKLEEILVMKQNDAIEAIEENRHFNAADVTISEVVFPSLVLSSGVAERVLRSLCG